MAASKTLDPEQRVARAQLAHLTGAVNTVAKRWATLTDEQREQIRAVACADQRDTIRA